MMLDKVPMMSVIAIFLTIVFSVALFVSQSILASSEDGRSIPPMYREGYDAGKAQGMKDSLGGEGHDDSCPQEKVTILWCIGYEIGYNDGYYDSEILGDS